MSKTAGNMRLLHSGSTGGAAYTFRLPTNGLNGVRVYFPMNPIAAETSRVVLRVGPNQLISIRQSIFDGIVETASILSDKTTMAAILDDIAQNQKGEPVSWEEVKASLGL